MCRLSRNPPRDSGGACALSWGGGPHLGDQIRSVAVGFSEQFQPSQLRANSLLKQLRGRKTSGFHQFVQIVGKVDLHACHTPKSTPSTPARKPAMVKGTPLLSRSAVLSGRDASRWWERRPALFSESVSKASPAGARA